MDKKTVTFLKGRFPRIFSWVARSPFRSRLVSELDRGRYMYCRLMNKPYFGTVGLAGQTWEQRKNYMRCLVEQEIQNKRMEEFNLLEIGSWAADSAVLWADAIKFCNCRGRVVCVDPWEPYIEDENIEKINSAVVLMNRALKDGKIFELFLHNVKVSGNAEVIFPIKGPSAKVLPLLQNESFDLVYIDGDHSYSGIKQDLDNSSRILRDGGVLCGDDFDLTIEQIDYEYACKNRQSDIIIDPKTKQFFHPGICLAVSEFFKKDVSSYNGFWAMRKAGDQWQRVEINL